MMIPTNFKDILLSVKRKNYNVTTNSNKFPNNIPSTFKSMVPSIFLYESGKKIIKERRILLLGKTMNIDWPPRWETKDTGIWPKDISLFIQYYGKDFDKDIKLIWEYNRLQWLPNICAFANINNDEKMASTILDVLVDYAQRHPEGKTVAWMEGIEVALRSISIIESLSHMRVMLKNDNRMKIINEYLSKHASWLSRHLSKKWILNNNHLLLELVGLSILGSLLTWHPKSEQWEERGMRLLAFELDKQIIDGRNWEPTTSYHRFVTESLLALIHYSDNKDTKINRHLKVIKKVAIEMSETLHWMSDERGFMPLIGDDDAAYIIPRGEYLNVKDNSIVLKYAKNLLNLNISEFEGNRIWNGQGMAVIKNKNVLIHAVSGAPKGNARDGSHRHLDMLSLSIMMSGKDVVLDSGTGLYFGSDAWRNYFREERNHSGIRSGSKSWAKISNLFEIENSPIGKIIEDDGKLLISALHPHGVTQTREISLVNDNVILKDKLIIPEPIITFVCESNAVMETTGDKIIIKGKNWQIEHRPVPIRIVNRNEKTLPSEYQKPNLESSIISTGYGEYSSSSIFEFHHEQGTIAHTEIFSI